MPAAERYFLVTSRGQSGCRWLAGALSSLEGVACSHGSGPSAKGPKGTQPLVGIGELFADISATQAAKAYGNVRGYTLSNLERGKALSPPGVPYRVANLVRHPITWVESLAQARAAEMASDPALRERFEDFYVANRRVCDAFTRPFGISPLEDDSLSFINAALGALPSYAEDLSWMGVPYIRMEDLLTRRETFKAVATYLLGDDIHVGHVALDALYGQDDMLRVAKDVGISSRAQFEAWPEWKRHAIGLIWETKPVVQGFTRLGYRFGFLKSVLETPPPREMRMSA